MVEMIQQWNEKALKHHFSKTMKQFHITPFGFGYN